MRALSLAKADSRERERRDGEDSEEGGRGRRKESQKSAPAPRFLVPCDNDFSKTTQNLAKKFSLAVGGHHGLSAKLFLFFLSPLEVEI